MIDKLTTAANDMMGLNLPSIIIVLCVFCQLKYVGAFRVERMLPARQLSPYAVSMVSSDGSEDATNEKPDSISARRRLRKKRGLQQELSKEVEELISSSETSDGDLTNIKLPSPMRLSSKQRRQLKAASKTEDDNPFNRLAKDYLAPTPTGKEPKLVELIKSVTWISVLVLIAVEIFVSFKVGGSPFDLKRAVLDSGDGTLPTPPP